MVKAHNYRYHIKGFCYLQYNTDFFDLAHVYITRNDPATASRNKNVMGNLTQYNEF